MVISVLERRGEIGLRRALGATRRHISTQFLAESALLAVLGGVAGLALGAVATWVYSLAQNQPMVDPGVRADRGARGRVRDRRGRRAVPGRQGRAAEPDGGVALDVSRARGPLRRADTPIHRLSECRAGVVKPEDLVRRTRHPRASFRPPSPLRTPIDCDEVRLVASGSIPPRTWGTGGGPDRDSHPAPLAGPSCCLATGAACASPADASAGGGSGRYQASTFGRFFPSRSHHSPERSSNRVAIQAWVSAGSITSSISK